MIVACLSRISFHYVSFSQLILGAETEMSSEQSRQATYSGTHNKNPSISHADSFVEKGRKPTVVANSETLEMSAI